MIRPSAKTGAILAILALGATLLLPACADNSADKHLAAAREYLKKNDNKAAIIEIKNALQKEPESAAARLLLGQAMLDSGDVRSAELELRKALELKSPLDEVLPPLLRTYLATGQFKRVVDEVAKAQLSSPEANAAAQTSLAGALAALGDRPGAEKAIAQALEKKPDHVPALIFQARLLAGSRKSDEAMAVIERALKIEPSSAEAWKFKGDLQIAGNERDAGLESYRKASAARPDFLIARMAVFSNLLAQSKTEDAAREFEAMKKIAPGHPLTLSAGAQLAFGNKDYQGAREYSQKLLRVTPDHPSALLQAGAIELRLKSFSQAEIFLTKALKANPQSLAARRWLALTYLGSGQSAKAVETLKPVLEGIKNDPAMLMLAGEAYMRNGDVAEAQEFFSAASKLDPGDARKRTSLALTRLASGEAEAGFAELEQISAGDTGTSADMALIAGHLRRGELDKGLKALDTLEKKQPDNPLPHEMRGRILLAKRDVAGARKSFERALALNPTYFPAIAGLAALDVSDKKPAEAVKRFETLLAAEPKNVQAHLALAGLKAQSGGTTEEVATLIRKAIAARPDELGPRVALMDVYLRAKDFSKAIAAGQEGIAAIRDRPEIYDALGQAQQAAGELNQALASYTKQAGLQPNATRPYLRMAEINIAAKKPDDAARNLRQALEIKSDLVDAQRGLIMLDLQSKREKNALALAREVQKQRPTEAIGHLLEGDVHATQKAWGPAVTAYRAGLKLAPVTEIAIRLHGALLAGGNQAEAGRFSADWVKNHPKDNGFQMHLGEAAIARNDLETASKKFRDLLAVLPENPVVLNNLAWVAGKQKAPDAIALAEKANKLAPNQPAFMDTLAMLLAEKGDTTRALDMLGRAVELAPQAPAIRLNYARVLIKAGKKTEARRQLEELAALGDKFPAHAEIEKLAQEL